MIGPWYVTTDYRRRTAWGNPCQSKATAGRVSIDGRSFVLSRDAVEAFEVWEKIRAKHGYKLTGSDTGFYNCRHMQHNPSLPYSYHSWGMALDVNWLENPAGSKLVTDIPQEMIDELLSVRTNSGARVFRWGGDWDWDGVSSDHSYIDAMHWEVVAHPLDLATGINYEGDDDMAIDQKYHQILEDIAWAVLKEGTHGGYMMRKLIEAVRDGKGIATVTDLKALNGTEIELEGKTLRVLVKEVQ